jgi:hypothetical protein
MATGIQVKYYDNPGGVLQPSYRREASVVNIAATAPSFHNGDFHGVCRWLCQCGTAKGRSEHDDASLACCRAGVGGISIYAEKPAVRHARGDVYLY